jgi:hypothetical protein
MSLDLDDADAWVRECTKCVVCLDPAIGSAQAEMLARSFWTDRSLDAPHRSPEAVACQMLAPPALPLRWLE